MHQFCIISIICISFVRGQVFDFSIPETLSIGVSTSSLQIEGAWNTSGKGESVWDWYVHAHPDRIIDGGNMDISTDSYRKYKEDIQLIKNIGFDFYRFSISWPRILPTGFADKVNEEGIQFYINLIKELWANGIEPVVTLYHWDHPQILEEMGGKSLRNVGKYLCMHNVIKAHAAAWHIYDKEFRSEQRGEVGLVMPIRGWLPNSTIDEAIELNFQFITGWVMHPIYFGDYPEIMKTRIEMISKLEGHPRSRLPEFTENEIEHIKGTADYFGLNHYTSNTFVLDPNEKLGNFTVDGGIIVSVNDSWPASKTASWLRDVPEGFGPVLTTIKNQYNNPKVYIFENGWSDEGELNDIDRIRYYHGYFKELITAIKRDGCNVQRYTMWSLLDNFELLYGFSARFGIVSVNFTDPERSRTLKSSATWWKSVLETRTLQDVPVLNTDSV